MRARITTKRSTFLASSQKYCGNGEVKKNNNTTDTRYNIFCYSYLDMSSNSGRGNRKKLAVKRRDTSNMDTCSFRLIANSGDSNGAKVRRRRSVRASVVPALHSAHRLRMVCSCTASSSCLVTVLSVFRLKKCKLLPV